MVPEQNNWGSLGVGGYQSSPTDFLYKDSPPSNRQHVNCDERESSICQNGAVICTAVVHTSQAHSVDWLERLSMK